MKFYDMVDGKVDVSTPEKLASFMSMSTDKQDWNRRCDMVKKACDGYPDYWYQTCISSGLINRVLGTGSDQIKISVVEPISKEGVSEEGIRILCGIELQRLLGE